MDGYGATGQPYVLIGSADESSHQVALDSGGSISKTDALALVTANLETLLGIKADPLEADLVATRGGDLLEFSKVVAVISPRRGVVDII